MIAAYAFATPDYDAAVRLRQRVLRVPLGLDIADDPLQEEWDQTHLGAYDADGTLVGTATLRYHPDGSLQMRQVAVDETHRGRGVGAALVRACEYLARASGSEPPRLFCHARDVARGFYERVGWRAVGEAFVEVGIEHVVMEWPGGSSDAEADAKPESGG